MGSGHRARPPRAGRPDIARERSRLRGPRPTAGTWDVQRPSHSGRQHRETREIAGIQARLGGCVVRISWGHAARRSTSHVGPKTPTWFGWSGSTVPRSSSEQNKAEPRCRGSRSTISRACFGAGTSSMGSCVSTVVAAATSCGSRSRVNRGRAAHRAQGVG